MRGFREHQRGIIVHLMTFRCWGYTDSQSTEKGLHSSPVVPYRGESVSMMPHVNKAHTDHSNNMNDVQQKAKKMPQVVRERIA